METSNTRLSPLSYLFVTMEECKFDEEEEDEIIKRMQIGDIYKSKFIEFSIEMIFCDAI